MSGQDAIQLEGSIIEVLSDRLFRVELANGHQMLGFSRRRDRERNAGLRPGEMVTLEVSPYDFSAGRVCGAVKEMVSKTN
jgi:translation initiation factor IF-1